MQLKNHVMLFGVHIVTLAQQSILECFHVHLFSERFPQFAARCWNRTRTTDGSDKAISCGFRSLVVQLLQRRMRLALWLHFKDPKRSIFSQGCGATSADGRKLGIQRWSASFGPCGWPCNASSRVLLFLV